MRFHDQSTGSKLLIMSQRLLDPNVSSFDPTLEPDQIQIEYDRSSVYDSFELNTGPNNVYIMTVAFLKKQK